MSKYKSEDDWRKESYEQILEVVLNPCRDVIFDRHKWSDVCSDTDEKIEKKGCLDLHMWTNIAKCSKCGLVRKKVTYYVPHFGWD